MKQNGTEKRFHPNGNIAHEVSYNEGKIHGISRAWHENGVLAFEVPMKDGFMDGTCRYWNEKGELLGSFEMREGTGISKHWHPNGALQFETSMVRNKRNGRSRTWDDKGTLGNQGYWLDNHPVSKREYLEACAKDPTLPRFDDDGHKAAFVDSNLCQAVIDDDEPAIEEALRKGDDLNELSSLTGGTLLQAACSLKHVRTIKALLRNGADPNQRFTFRSPIDGKVEKEVVALHFATTPEVVTALLEGGSDVQAADARGTTALMRAVFGGNTEVVKALLAAGASPFVRQHKQRGKKAHTAREMVESKIELWKELKSEARQRDYEELRQVLLDAESRGLPTNG